MQRLQRHTKQLQGDKTTRDMLNNYKKTETQNDYLLTLLYYPHTEKPFSEIH